MGLAAFNRARRQRAEIENVEQPDVDNNSLTLLRERGKELGIPRASQMGEPKLIEAIAAKEAEIQAKEAELAETAAQQGSKEEG